MPDETAAALQEIAQLLRRRVEQQDESAKIQAEAIVEARERTERSEKRLAEMDTNHKSFDFSKIQSDSADKMEKLLQQSKAEKERLRDEERQFKARLLTELERHNSLLERLLQKLDG